MKITTLETEDRTWVKKADKNRFFMIPIICIIIVNHCKEVYIALTAFSRLQ